MHKHFTYCILQFIGITFGVIDEDLLAYLSFGVYWLLICDLLILDKWRVNRRDNAMVA